MVLSDAPGEESHPEPSQNLLRKLGRFACALSSLRKAEMAAAGGRQWSTRVLQLTLIDAPHHFFFKESDGTLQVVWVGLDSQTGSGRESHLKWSFCVVSTRSACRAVVLRSVLIFSSQRVELFLSCAKGCF